MKKHRHRNGKLELLIKWLGYLNLQNTWKAEDHLPPALVQEYFQQSPLEKPTPSNAAFPTSDVYRPCQLLLNKKVCWMVIFTLITVIILTAVAFHTHCHFKPHLESRTGRNPTWKELLACGTSIRFTVTSQLVESKKNRRLCLLDWALPPVLAKKLQLSNHLVLGAYNPLHLQNTTLIQTVTHALCRFVIRDEESPSSSIKAPNETPWALPNSLYCHAPSYIFYSLTNWIMEVFALTPFLYFCFYTYTYNFL